MCLLKNKRRVAKAKKHPAACNKINKKTKKMYDYLIEDPSIKNEAHSRWEAEAIYDEDDFND